MQNAVTNQLLYSAGYPYSILMYGSRFYADWLLLYLLNSSEWEPMRTSLMIPAPLSYQISRKSEVSFDVAFHVIGPVAGKRMRKVFLGNRTGSSEGRQNRI